MSWLPDDFEHPRHVDLGTGHHLRPIRAEDVDLDMPAVMGSQERLWSVYGEAWGWPPATMTAEQDREDLARHEAEQEAHESFNYALLDDAETELIGCCYIDPPEKQAVPTPRSPGGSATSTSGRSSSAALDAFVPRWIASVWPFEAPRYVGRDLTWAEWIALPDR